MTRTQLFTEELEAREQKTTLKDSSLQGIPIRELGTSKDRLFKTDWSGADTVGGAASAGRQDTEETVLRKSLAFAGEQNLELL